MVEELKKMSPGESKLFTYQDDGEVYTFRAVCRYVARRYHKRKIKFTTKDFPEKKQLLITANKVKMERA